jgi:H+/Cl- antiporter ClcA
MSAGVAVGWTILQNLIGLTIGIVFGLFGWFFNYIPNYNVRMWVKFLYCAAMAIAIVVCATMSNYTELKYIGALFFGYTC